MSGTFFSIGLTGLNAAQLNLLATEHNIVNANTDGYSRQRVVQASNNGYMLSTGSVGQGVNVVTTQRLYDQFVTGRLNSDQAQVSSLDAFYGMISQIDSMLADANAGLSPAMQDFFKGVQQVAANPSLLPARQSMISSAETMVARYQSLDTRLQEMNDQVNSRITNVVTEINGFAKQVADLNYSIRIAESSYGQPANDLRDQRDQLVAELNQRVKVTTVSASDGTYNLFFGSGQQLVVGSTAIELTAQESKADPSKIAVGLNVGVNQELPDSLIVGGELGGLISFRNQALEGAANEIGRVAASMALTFNAQHALGQDLTGTGNIDGDLGFVGDFFKIPDPRVIANKDNSATITVDDITASFAPPSAPGSPDYTGNFSTALTNSNYQLQFTNGTGGYSLTRLNDNVVVSSGTLAAGASLTVDGVKIDVAALGSNGDKFVIKPSAEIARDLTVNTRIAADPRLVAAAAPVKASPTITNAGSMTLSQGVVGAQEDGSQYDASALPITLTASATQLSGVPTGWRAVYSDGSVVPPMSSPAGTGNVALDIGSTTLSRLTFEGMSFEVNGKPAAGDTFKIERNTGGVQDSRNAVLLAKLQTQNTTGGGTASFQSSYARLVAENGIMTREAKVQMDARSSVLTQTQATRDSLSAVNLDEEAANLLKFQQAYQASAKILDIGGKLFESILAIG